MPPLQSVTRIRILTLQSSNYVASLKRWYDYDEVRAIVNAFGFTAHLRARGEEAKAIKREAGFRARRWMFERTHN